MILNLTQHPATPEQVAHGVKDLPDDLRAELCSLLTVDSLPTQQELQERCAQIAAMGQMTDAENMPAACMVGGAPWMMVPLVRALRDGGFVQILAAFSKRESVEETMPDGSVRKVNVFRHAGFLEC